MRDLQNVEVDADEKLLSDIGTLTSFVERSLIWKDMKMVVEGWIEEQKRALIDPALTDTLEALADYQGRVYMCENFKQLPQYLIDILEDQQRERKDVSNNKEEE